MRICLWFLVGLSWATVAWSQNRSELYFEDNAYRKTLISISEDVPENAELITRIQEVFTETSKTLFENTKNRAYIKDVTILVPKTWRNVPALPAAREGSDKSDIVVDISNKQYGQGDRPFTLKTTGCGEFGNYIRLTDKYLLDVKEADKYGDYGKVMTHEWAHYRFGIFDEYVADTEDADHFYAARNGKMEATKCTAILTGRMYNRNTGVDGCKYTGQVPEPGCRFRDDVMPGKYASIMYKTRLTHLDGFCDNRGSVHQRHNSEAPTQQNRLCSGQSVWEVLDKHPDFAEGRNEPLRGDVDTTPEFKVVRQVEKKVVLVLDISDSMSKKNRMEKLGHGCSNYIWNVMRDGENLGIVEFNHFGAIRMNVTPVNNETRSSLVSAIPIVPSGGTSIGGGLEKGLEALNTTGSTEGGTLIVVSDGEETAPPKIPAVFDKVIDARVTVHTIAFSNEADPNMDALAQATAGLSFLCTDSDTSNALNEAFRTIGELNADPDDKKYTLFSDADVLRSGEQRRGEVVLDASLGRETDFVIDYARKDVTVVIESPSGVKYDQSNSICKHDKTFKAYTFSIPKTADAGRWIYDVTNGDTQDQRMALSVASKSAVKGESPMIARAFWERRNLGLGGNSPKEQKLFVMVSKGYAPVLKGDVEASVERPQGNKPIEVRLKDDGAGADAIADDGVYSAYFLQFNSNGRYNVKVSVNSNPTTVISPRRIIGRGAPTGPLGQEDVYRPDEPTGDFQRSETGGSFQLGQYTPDTEYYPPGTIFDLRVKDADRRERTVTLTWTATGSQLDVGQASRYELRMGDSADDLLPDFEGQAPVTDDMITNGAKLTEPKPTGEQETFVIKLASTGDVTHAFAVRAVAVRSGSDVKGPVSNVEGVSMAEFPQVPGGGLATGAIVGIAIAVVALVVLAVGTVFAAGKRKQKATADVTLSKPWSKPDNEIPRATDPHVKCVKIHA